MVALVAGPAGQTGTFLKTPLNASASWSAGSQAGDFSWSYDMAVPESAGGLDPEIGLSYSSGRVDGQTNGENTQTSWIGEGWDYHPGYIERSYRTCKDDLANSPAYTNATGDLCWRDYNATLVLNGKSTELVRDDTTQLWRLADDDGSKIEYDGWDQYHPELEQRAVAADHPRWHPLHVRGQLGRWAGDVLRPGCAGFLQPHQRPLLQDGRLRGLVV